MAKDWRLLLSPPARGPANMAIDQTLFQSLQQGGVPTLRFYSWQDACITIGRHQDGAAELDEALCATRDVGLVRRPTGGRAILHAPGDLTYSLTVSEGDDLIAGGVMESYRSINRALVEGLGLLGIRAMMRERPPLWPDTGVGVGCFEAAYRHEVYWAGRKLVASAQRRQGGGLLQQGQIPGAETGARLAEFVKAGPGRRTTLARDLADRTGTLRRALDRNPTFEEATQAMAEGFRRAWAVRLIPGGLTAEERALASQLERKHVEAGIRPAQQGATVL